MEQKIIDDFTGRYFFLSNFFECPVNYKGIVYNNSEAAFQAQKLASPLRRIDFSNLNPSQAKRLGRAVPLREDWEQIKVYEMYCVLEAKFTQNSQLLMRLIWTKDAELVEGNTWGDMFWGRCNGKGQNMLGKLLMDLRQKYRQSNCAVIKIDDLPTDCHECAAFFEGECCVTGNTEGMFTHHRPDNCPIRLAAERDLLPLVN